MDDSEEDSMGEADVGSYARQVMFKGKVITCLHQNLERLYDQDELFDVTICIGGETFQCHAVVLAAASDFFRASLTSSWCESSSRVINIDHTDVTEESFRLLLDILYRGKDVVTEETAKCILQTAVFLQIRFLQKDAEQVLLETMSPSTCLGIWQLALQYDLEQFGQKAFDWAVARLDEVSKCEEFILLPKALLLKLLSSDSKKISTDDLFRGVMRWVDAGEDVNKQHLPELLPFIMFPDLTPSFLWEEAVSHRNHPLRDVLSDYIDEAVRYNMCGKMVNNKKIQTEILARQHKAAESLGMKKHLVMFGGYLTEGNKSVGAAGMSCFPLTDEGSAIKTLAPLPAGFGQSLSSCVWRNEVYVCSGCTQSKHFAVYKPGSGDWETLPHMPRGRKKHSMAAVNWNVYVVGGLEEHPDDGKRLAPDVLAYNIKTRVWVACGKLTLPLQDTAAAVLGHRIYVFGGQDAGGAMTDTVQCVDTLTGHVYTAGRLPSMTCGAQAVSDGGTIHVATRAGQVLIMRENFVLADERKRLTQTADVMSATSLERSVTESCSLKSLPEGDGHRLPESIDVSPDKEILPVAAYNVDEPLSTVNFSTIGNFPARSDFGVYLHGAEMVVCGGWTAGELSEKESDDELSEKESDDELFEVKKADELSGGETVAALCKGETDGALCEGEMDGELHYDQMGVNVKTGKLTHKERTLISSRAGFRVHVLCVPDEHVGEDEMFTEGTMRYGFTPSSLTEGSRLKSKTATIVKCHWCLLVQRNDEDNPANVGMYVTLVHNFKRKTKITAQYSIRVKKTEGACMEKSGVYSFSDVNRGNSRGWRAFTTFDKLKNYLQDGKVIVDFTVKPGVTQNIT